MMKILSCSFWKSLGPFFFKMFKIWCRFQKKFLVLKIIAFELGLQNFTIPNGILVIGSQCVRKHISCLTHNWGRYFPNQFLLEWWKNMRKVLSCSCCKSFRPFNMLTVQGRSETVFFIEWCNQVFHSL